MADNRQEALREEGGASAYIMELKAKKTIKFLREYHIHNDPPSSDFRNSRDFRNMVIEHVMTTGYALPGTETNNGMRAVLRFSKELVCFVLFYVDFIQIEKLRPLFKSGIPMRTPTAPWEREKDYRVRRH